MRILYEDNHLFIVDKPSGLLTQPSDKEEDSLEMRAKQWIKEAHQKKGNVFLGVVHRLDKPVGGIVLFAKTSKALSRLNEAIRSKGMVKMYWALVEGFLEKKEGVLNHYLIHDDYHTVISGQEDKKAKLATLHYKTIKQGEGKSLLEIQLETGRYHQIRAQCAAVGHPVIGDLRYGASKRMQMSLELSMEEIALHHKKLIFSHPVIEKEMCIESTALPSYFSFSSI